MFLTISLVLYHARISKLVYPHPIAAKVEMKQAARFLFHLAARKGSIFQRSLDLQILSHTFNVVLVVHHS